MRIALLVFLGIALAGCDHDVHEAMLPVSHPPVAFSHPPACPRLFLASVFRDQVVFDVFTLKNGRWNQSRSQPLSPGDAIPGTDWSVLDVREDLHGNGEKYALLLNNDGGTERQDF